MMVHSKSLPKFRLGQDLRVSFGEIGRNENAKMT